MKELREQVIPDATQVRDGIGTSYGGRVNGASSTYIDALLDYNQTVKQYLDTAVRHRRSMLSLNTVVGRRIMP